MASGRRQGGNQSFVMLPFDPHFLFFPRWPVMGLAVAFVLIIAWRQAKTGPWEVARELVILVPAYFLYVSVRGMVSGREAEAFQRAAEVIRFERGLGFFWEADMQSRILNYDVVVGFSNAVYTWAHWPVIIFTAVWLFLMHRQQYPVYRNAFLISGGIGLIIFATLPVAPPRFMGAWGFVDTIAVHSSFYQVMQPPAFTNQYAAMPSLHVGWNMLAGIAMVRHARFLPMRVFGAIVPLAMFTSVVLTGNHFIIDGIAGCAVCLLALAISVKLNSYLSRPDAGASPRYPQIAVPAS